MNVFERLFGGTSTRGQDLSIVVLGDDAVGKTTFIEGCQRFIESKQLGSCSEGTGRQLKLTFKDGSRTWLYEVNDVGLYCWSKNKQILLVKLYFWFS